jgi:hypothetical protein
MKQIVRGNHKSDWIVFMHAWNETWIIYLICIACVKHLFFCVTLSLNTFDINLLKKLNNAMCMIVKFIFSKFLTFVIFGLTPMAINYWSHEQAKSTLQKRTLPLFNGFRVVINIKKNYLCRNAWKISQKPPHRFMPKNLIFKKFPLNFDKALNGFNKCKLCQEFTYIIISVYKQQTA